MKKLIVMLTAALVTVGTGSALALPALQRNQPEPVCAFSNCTQQETHTHAPCASADCDQQQVHLHEGVLFLAKENTAKPTAAPSTSAETEPKTKTSSKTTSFVCDFPECTRKETHRHTICNLEKCTKTACHEHNGVLYYGHHKKDGHGYHNGSGSQRSSSSPYCNITGCNNQKQHTHTACTMTDCTQTKLHQHDGTYYYGCRNNCDVTNCQNKSAHHHKRNSHHGHTS